MILQQGIHSDIPMSVYLSDPALEPSLSAGCARTIIERSPMHAHWEHPRLGGHRDSGGKRSDFGSAAHEVLLGGSQAVAYGDPDWGDWKKKDARAFRDAIRADGRTPMLHRERDKLEAMVEPARKALAEMAGPAGGARTEQTLIWQDGDIWCRARPDWISPDGETMVDYKTATNADPLAWTKTVLFGGGYDYSAAHYLRGLEKIADEANRAYIFLVQEIDPPYAISRVGVDPEVIEHAEAKLALARQTFGRCLTSGEWPGYGDHVHWAALPTYKAWDWEAREMMIGGGR